jgi:hypothetical protein
MQPSTADVENSRDAASSQNASICNEHAEHARSCFATDRKFLQIDNGKPELIGRPTKIN